MITRYSTLVFSTFALLSVAGCSSGESPFPTEATVALYTAIAREDLAGAAALCTDDVVFLPPNQQPIRGNAAVHAYYESYIQHNLTYTTQPEATVVRKDVAIEQGVYRVRDIDKAQDIETGKYLNVWRLTDGKGKSWKLWRSSWSTNGPIPSVTVTDVIGAE